MEYTDSQKTLISDVVMSMIFGEYHWHKTTSTCLNQSDEVVLKQLQEGDWFKFEGGYSSKLGFWKKRKLNSLYIGANSQRIVFKKSKILIGIYAQIRIDRENSNTHYIDGVKYSDFENNRYTYDFDINPNALFEGFNSNGIKQLDGKYYSCHTYVNYGSNLPLCPNCHGDGSFRCTHCNGSGIISKRNGEYADGRPKYVKAKCGDCYGKGSIPCNVCHGSGKVNLRSERYQELKSFEEYQKASITILAKIPFSNDLIQLQYEPENFPLKRINGNGIFEDGHLVLWRKSIHNSLVDNRNMMANNINEIGKKLLDLFHGLAYDERDGILAYSAESYLQIPITAIICSNHNGLHTIYAIENYKKEKGIYNQITTFVTKELA